MSINTGEDSTNLWVSFRLPPGVHHRSRTPPGTYLRTPPGLHQRPKTPTETVFHSYLSRNAGLSAHPICKILLNIGKPGNVPMADGIFLRDIHKEAQDNMLSQEPHPLITMAQENTSNASTSKIWTPIKDDKNDELYRAWPQVTKFKASVHIMPEPLDAMTPDELFEHLNPQARRPVALAAVAPKVKTRPEAKATLPLPRRLRGNSQPQGAAPRTSGTDVKSKKKVPIMPRGWKPPPEFVPGMPFHGAAPVQPQGQKNYPDLTANSGSFPPRAPIEGLGNHLALHQVTENQSGLRIEPSSGFFFGPDPIQGQTAVAVHYTPFPLHTGRTYPTGPRASHGRSQSYNSVNPSRMGVDANSAQNMQQRGQVGMRGNSGGYYPNSQLPASRHKSANFQSRHRTSNSGSYDGNLVNHSTYKSNDKTSSNNSNLLNATRGVFIRNIPKGANLSQICSNVRGGAIDFIYFQRNEGKVDAGIMFTQAESARTYKHWTNKAGGIWWDPSHYSESYPSFTAFIGPEGGGHERVKDHVKDAMSNDGATRCLLLVGLPDPITPGQLLHDIYGKSPLTLVDVESLQVIIHNDDGQGKGKNTAILKLASIAKALDLRRIFSEDRIYKGVKVYFSVDECAGPIKELVEKRERMDQSQAASGNRAPTRHRRHHSYHTRR